MTPSAPTNDIMDLDKLELPKKSSSKPRKEESQARTPIAWVQFAKPIKPDPSEPLTEALVTQDAMKLWLVQVEGLPCITVEHPTFKSPGYFPLATVVSFGFGQ